MPVTRTVTAEVKLLITVRGITPLTALAFLADVADIRRFNTLRRMNAYLGLVPTVNESGGKSESGHITRQSRRLTRTLFTQSVMHLLEQDKFSWMQPSNFERKLKRYECQMKKIKKVKEEERKIARLTSVV